MYNTLKLMVAFMEQVTAGERGRPVGWVAQRLCLAKAEPLARFQLTLPPFDKHEHVISTCRAA